MRPSAIFRSKRTRRKAPAVTFTGLIYDPDTRLYHALGRWYDADTGTWLRPDPLGFAAGDANLYRYCGNSPTNFTDPSGRIPAGGGWAQIARQQYLKELSEWKRRRSLPRERDPEDFGWNLPAAWLYHGLLKPAVDIGGLDIDAERKRKELRVQGILDGTDNGQNLNAVSQESANAIAGVATLGVEAIAATAGMASPGGDIPPDLSPPDFGPEAPEANAGDGGGGFDLDPPTGVGKSEARDGGYIPGKPATPGGSMGFGDAVDTVSQGGDVFAGGRGTAKEIAGAAGDGPPIWNGPHNPGELPHYHPSLGGVKQPGHVWY